MAEALSSLRHVVLTTSEKGAILSTIAIACLVLGALVAGTAIGLFVRHRVSDDMLDQRAADVIKMAAAFIATLSALVLSLLITTAKTSFDEKIGQVKQLTASAILLDQMLAQYGPDATDVRRLGRQNFNVMVDRIWREHLSRQDKPSPFEVSQNAETFLQEVYSLAPRNELQRALKERIVEAVRDLAKTRLALFVQSGSTISAPFLFILVFWLTMLFAVFGLLNRINLLVGATLFFCALSVSASIFLIVDFDRAFEGTIRIPSAPLRNALPPLNSQP